MRSGASLLLCTVLLIFLIRLPVAAAQTQGFGIEFPGDINDEKQASYYYGTPDGRYEVFFERSTSRFFVLDTQTGRTNMVPGGQTSMQFEENQYILTPERRINLKTGEEEQLNLEKSALTQQDVPAIERFQDGRAEEQKLISLQRLQLDIVYHEPTKQYIVLSVLPNYNKEGLIEYLEQPDNRLWLDYYSRDGVYLKSIRTGCQARLISDSFYNRYEYSFENLSLWGDYAVLYDYTGKSYEQYGRIAAINLYTGERWYMDGILFRISGNRVMTVDYAQDEWGTYYLQAEQYVDGRLMSAFWKKLGISGYPVEVWYLRYRPQANELYISDFTFRFGDKPVI